MHHAAINLTYDFFFHCWFACSKMPIRILFEIGHKAARKAKPLDAFTHDWELFVRGLDGKEMSKYVEKIVFNLHESFPNPIRCEFI